MKTSADLLRSVAVRGCLMIACALPALALAQETTSIVGTVLDETTFAPVAGAVVTVPEFDGESLTDVRGNFVFQGVPAGHYTLRVAAPGFSTAVDQVQVAAGEMGFLQVFLLPVAAVLDEVLVLTGRSRADQGTVVNGGDRQSAITAADLLEQQVPGLTVGRGSGVGAGTRMIIRGIKSFTGNNLPAVYLDGVRITSSDSSLPPNGGPGLSVLDDMPASQVRRIRVLKGPSASAQFADSANGVILIETYQGERERD